MSAYPMVDSKMPRHATVRPFKIDPPLNEPTMASPSTPSMNSSGELNARMMGRMRGREAARISAPNTPPKADTVKAAPKARAAFPC